MPTRSYLGRSKINYSQGGAGVFKLVVSVHKRYCMKEAFLLLVSILFSITLYANGIIGETESSHNAFLKTQDSLISQIHPTIKQLFYDLPLEKSRKDLREIILNDKRFVSTDSIFNNYEPDTFFKGNSVDQGQIGSMPDSMQILLALGYTSLSTEKEANLTLKIFLC